MVATRNRKPNGIQWPKIFISMKKLVLILSLVVSRFGFLLGQTGGEGIYKFLDITNSAKVAALGGSQVAFTDNELGLTLYNPSLLSDSMCNQLSINYISYIARIGAGYVSFAPKIKGKGIFAGGIHYVDYGKFDGASETGQPTGTFGAAEYAINLLYSREISPRLRVGANLKPIYSSFETYRSYGLAADLGITSLSKDGFSAFSLVVRNIGRQLTTYYDNAVREKLPWDIQIGFSKRLAHAPLRILVTANHLNKWDLSYKDNQSGNTQTTGQSNGAASLMMRHLIFGVELLPGQYVSLRLGYNYQRQQELSIKNRPGLVGFSGGIGVKVAKFNFSYAIASYHLSATSHYFSLAANLPQFVH